MDLKFGLWMLLKDLKEIIKNFFLSRTQEHDGLPDFPELLSIHISPTGQTATRIDVNAA